MLLDTPNRCIYIFAGQRGKETLTDLCCYSIPDDKMTEIAQDFLKDDGPEFVYTQRASINSEKQEIYVLSGFLKSKPRNLVRNYLWVYSIRQNKWEKVYESNNEDPTYWQRMEDVEPCPRYTHQLVYNPKTSAHYLLGGNPGDIQKPCRRLDDFWELKLAK
jgi:transcriptional accessory protein Tex/SPT6